MCKLTLVSLLRLKGKRTKRRRKIGCEEGPLTVARRLVGKKERDRGDTASQGAPVLVDRENALT